MYYDFYGYTVKDQKAMDNGHAFWGKMNELVQIKLNELHKTDFSITFGELLK